jgi:signal transduction histidine kinase
LTISTQSLAPDDVLVTVRDTGPGLDAPKLDRLFEAFYTTKPGGLGIGLSICRSIVEAHGGRLWAETNSPRGAVFQFTLRQLKSDSRAAPAQYGSDETPDLAVQSI